MLNYCRTVLAGIVVLSFAPAICEQDGDSPAIANSSSMRAARYASDTNVDAPYTLSKE